MQNEDLEFIRMNKPWIKKDDEIVEIYQKESPWGMSISIDLHKADPKHMRDENFIKKFIKDLVIFINMKAYGEPIIKSFGEDPKVAGISVMQLIETSSITAHFANFTNSIYVDIFSCTHFRPHETALFCKNYFKAVDLTISPVSFRF